MVAVTTVHTVSLLVLEIKFPMGGRQVVILRQEKSHCVYSKNPKNDTCFPDPILTLLLYFRGMFQHCLLLLGRLTEKEVVFARGTSKMLHKLLSDINNQLSLSL